MIEGNCINIINLDSMTQIEQSRKNIWFAIRFSVKAKQ